MSPRSSDAAIRIATESGPLSEEDVDPPPLSDLELMETERPTPNRRSTTEPGSLFDMADEDTDNESDDDD